MILAKLWQKLKRCCHASTSPHPEETSISIGSEALHDAGLTDTEVSARALADRTGARKEHYIKHNDLLPEEKISMKQKGHTPV